MEICDICHENCDERGDRTIHKAEGLTFCSCCVIWYEESKRKARVIELFGQESLKLTPREFLMIYDGMTWKGFVYSDDIMRLARKIQGNGGSYEIEMTGEVIRVDIHSFTEELSMWLADLDPPDGYCPLDTS